jgi:hypothetical protein
MSALIPSTWTAAELTTQIQGLLGLGIILFVVMGSLALSWAPRVISFFKKAARGR